MLDGMTRTPGLAALALAAVIATGACSTAPGGEATPTPSPTSVTDATPTSAPTPTPAPAPAPAPVDPPPAPVPPPTEPEGLEQPALWPAADVVITSPGEAAFEFVEQVLRVPPTLGEFRQGDSRSGEIDVFSPGEGDSGTRVLRGTLVLRQLGPDDGWFVIGAASDPQQITVPEALATVPAGPVTVEGAGRGFEATLIVSAILPGQAQPLAEVVAQGGAFADPEPFSVELDLSSARAGQTVGLLLRGGTGLSTDPGDFAAIVVVVADG